MEHVPIGPQKYNVLRNDIDQLPKLSLMRRGAANCASGRFQKYRLHVGEALFKRTYRTFAQSILIPITQSEHTARLTEFHDRDRDNRGNSTLQSTDSDVLRHRVSTKVPDPARVAGLNSNLGGILGIRLSETKLQVLQKATVVSRRRD
jgi:hypothetical protein